MKMRRYRSYLIPLFLVFLLACSALSPRRIPFLSDRPQECQEFLNVLDEKVSEAGMRDAAHFPISGFPYLRTNRFLASLGADVKDDEAGKQWIQWMQQLDLESRWKEIRNLPDEAILSLGSKRNGRPDREGLFARVESSSHRLLKYDMRQPDFYETLHPLVRVPDEYSFSRRAIGLYPLFSIPITIATKSSHGKFKSWYIMNLDDLPIDGDLLAFVPSQKGSLGERELQGLLENSRKKPLGVPVPSGEYEKRIVAHCAPIIFQDVAAPYDRFGRIIWEGNRVAIDGQKPLVYYYISHGFLKGEPILQINYVIWYPERAGKRSPWIERGHLDGMTVRVSLDTRGRPFMVDVTNNCGCYHFFVPKKASLDRVISKPLGLDPFVPQWLPEAGPGKRLGIRVNSGYHQVERILASEIPSKSIPYELVPYEVLEALPREGGRTESMFDEDGIAKGSERWKEEVLFFSMGVPSVGSMRQRGNHPLVLVGRAHFDDPSLFEKNFVFK
jgi:hypothetical protein